jgi:methionyl aminopeptidase
LDSYDRLESFKRSGSIVSKIRTEIPKIVAPGRPAIRICEEVELRIAQLGGRPAFPVNIGIDDVAAHYTSPPGDIKTIPERSLVKVDFGVHINGYVTDTSITVCFNPQYEPLVHAADEALRNAIDAFKPGVRLGDIGAIVQRTVKAFDLRPISNLTGHSIDQYIIHAGKSVPNISGMDGAKINEGEVYAIEPFVTTRDAEGVVVNGEEPHKIYRYARPKRTNSAISRNMLAYIHANFRSLPFAARWLEKAFSQETITSSLQELKINRSVSSYPVLVEMSGAPVAQSEHTVFVNHDSCTILTGPKA